MSEKNKVGGFSNFEDGLKASLYGDELESALSFVNYLKINGIMTVFSGQENIWHVRYQSEHVCVIAFFSKTEKPICFYDGVTKQPEPWTIFWGDYDDYEHVDVQVDEQFKEYCWASVHICENCPCNSLMNMSRTIFGKYFENLCHCSLAFTNPNADEMEHIKKLVEMRKCNIDDKRVF